MSCHVLPAREVEPRRVDAALGVEGARLCDGAGLLEAVSRLVVPEVDGAVVPAAYGHTVLVHRQGVDRRIVPTEILQKPIKRGKKVERHLLIQFSSISLES